MLITSEWILTAGHNFYVAEEQTEPALPEGIFVLTGNNPNSPTGTYEVEQLVFHPTWMQDNEDFLNANDFCLVKLSSPITNITPAQLITSTSEIIGNTIWYCGFGDYTQEFGNGEDYSKKHAIENILDRKVDGINTSISGQTYNGGLLAFDFDSPTGEVNSLGDDEVNSDEALLGSGSSDAYATEFEGATIPGDSGGPIFININGAWKVCGILSGGANDPFYDYVDGGYGDISVFTRVSTSIDWILSVIQ
ncbi:MAG: trypsin-like serine protease [Bacteroidales bacterium]|nr:trypsin-like serine protease [Bacteroidales bacterium]